MNLLTVIKQILKCLIAWVLKMIKIIKNPRYRIEQDGKIVSWHKYKKNAKKKLKVIESKDFKLAYGEVRKESLANAPSSPKKPKKCNWKQYIVPKATGYKTYTKSGAVLWVTNPLPPTPQVKYKDYEHCEWIELNEAVSILRPIRLRLKKGRSAGSRPNIINLSDRRGVKLKRKQLGAGKEGIYIPKPLIDEMIANWEEEEKRYPK